jgi:hypothetical protein
VGDDDGVGVIVGVAAATISVAVAVGRGVGVAVVNRATMMVGVGRGVGVELTSDSWLNWQAAWVAARIIKTRNIILFGFIPLFILTRLKNL